LDAGEAWATAVSEGKRTEREDEWRERWDVMERKVWWEW
jgi:hypothetical protein